MHATNALMKPHNDHGGSGSFAYHVGFPDSVGAGREILDVCLKHSQLRRLPPRLQHHREPDAGRQGSGEAQYGNEMVAICLSAIVTQLGGQSFPHPVALEAALQRSKEAADFSLGCDSYLT